MGAGNSKASPAEQIFNSSHPIRFSDSLVSNLQSSPETDGTRLKTADLHVQERVTAELEKLKAQQEQYLKEATEKLSVKEDKPSEEVDAGNRLRQLGREAVQKDIDSLKELVEKRRKIEALNQDVEAAREQVGRCLRTNDRKPLDCWKEVEAFKREVGKLEKAFIEKTVR